MQSSWRLGRLALAWLVMLGAGALVVVAVIVPRVGGAEPYTILTGSMAPALPPGTLAVVRPTEVESLSVGDVVTIQLESGRPGVVTHRVSALSYAIDGTLSIRTKGDANETPDTDLRRPEQVRGKLWYAVPQVGRLGWLATGHERQVAAVALGVGLLGYAALMFVGAARDRRRRTDESEPPAQEEAGQDEAGQEARVRHRA